MEAAQLPTSSQGKVHRPPAQETDPAPASCALPAMHRRACAHVLGLSSPLASPCPRPPSLGPPSGLPAWRWLSVTSPWHLPTPHPLSCSSPDESRRRMSPVRWAARPDQRRAVIHHEQLVPRSPPVTPAAHEPLFRRLRLGSGFSAVRVGFRAGAAVSSEARIP